MIQGQRLYYPVSFIRNEKYYNEYILVYLQKIHSSNNIKKRQTPSSGSAMSLLMIK